MSKFTAWLIGLILGAVALFGLGFIPAVDKFWDDSHDQVREWLQPQVEAPEDTTPEIPEGD